MNNVDWVAFLRSVDSIFIGFLVLIVYVLIRLLVNGSKFFNAHLAEETDLISQKKITVVDLQNTTWKNNFDKVLSYAPLGLSILIVGAVLLVENQYLSVNIMLMVFIVILFCGLSVLAYFFSLYLWFNALDFGISEPLAIFHRKQATRFQAVGWISLVVAALFSLTMINELLGAFFVILGSIGFIYIFESRAKIIYKHAEVSKRFSDLLITDIFCYSKGRKINLAQDNSKQTDGCNTSNFVNPDQELDNDMVPANKHIGVGPDEFLLCQWNVSFKNNGENIVKFLKKQILDNPEMENKIIVCLQEVDICNSRSGWIDIAEEISNQLGMNLFYGLEFFEIESPFRLRKSGGGGLHGNAILTNLPVESIYRIELPQPYAWEHPERKKIFGVVEKRKGGRFALCVEIRISQENLVVCSTHLEDKYTNYLGRLQQIEKITHSLNSKARIVISGDLNTLETKFLRLIGYTPKAKPSIFPNYKDENDYWVKKVLPELGLKSASSKEWTYKLGSVKRKLDWVLFSKDTINISSYSVKELNGSDHRPIVVKFTLN